MTRTALTAAALAALAVVCLPLRADSGAFARDLEEAVHQLTQQGEELIFRHSGSVMAQNLARLFSEVGSQLLSQNEQLETIKLPEEERIPILRQIYLQRMRRIHEMGTDGNSRALYNERHQSLGFYHFSSTGGGGGSVPEFALKLQSLLKIEESIGGDPAASGLMEGLQELSHKWHSDFLSKHGSEILHIIQREIVRPNPAGLTSPPPTPLERSMGLYLGILMWQLEYELTKLDVELAEREATREERAKKLRNLFFEIIREVEYIGLKVQVEGAAVKIPFRDANGPILDSAGAPIAFEFPPKLMAALNMQALTQGNAKRLQLLMGGGAAFLLLVLAGVFFTMRRNSATEAETES